MSDSADPSTLPPAGWFPDPDDPGLLRYWTGLKWTEDRSPAVQPPGPAAAPVVSAATVPAPVGPSAASLAAAPMVTIVRVAKSTTAGVLLWLFLGTVGAHRHYVGRHGTAAIQTILYLLGWILFSVGMNTQNPGGVGPNTTLATVGGLIAVPVGLWVLIDVFLVPGWVRDFNDEEAASLRRMTERRMRAAERGF